MRVAEEEDQGTGTGLGHGQSPCMNEFVRGGQKPRRPTKVIGFAHWPPTPRPHRPGRLRALLCTALHESSGCMYVRRDDSKQGKDNAVPPSQMFLMRVYAGSAIRFGSQRAQVNKATARRGVSDCTIRSCEREEGFSTWARHKGLLDAMRMTDRQAQSVCMQTPAVSAATAAAHRLART